MFWTNFSGCLVAIALAGVTGQVTGGYAFCQRNPEVHEAQQQQAVPPLGP